MIFLRKILFLIIFSFVTQSHARAKIGVKINLFGGKHYLRANWRDKWPDGKSNSYKLNYEHYSKQKEDYIQCFEHDIDKENAALKEKHGSESTRDKVIDDENQTLKDGEIYAILQPLNDVEKNKDYSDWGLFGALSLSIQWKNGMWFWGFEFGTLWSTSGPELVTRYNSESEEEKNLEAKQHKSNVLTEAFKTVKTEVTNVFYGRDSLKSLGQDHKNPGGFYALDKNYLGGTIWFVGIYGGRYFHSRASCLIGVGYSYKPARLLGGNYIIKNGQQETYDLNEFEVRNKGGLMGFFKLGIHINDKFEVFFGITGIWFNSFGGLAMLGSMVKELAKSRSTAPKEEQAVASSKPTESTVVETIGEMNISFKIYCGVSFKVN